MNALKQMSFATLVAVAVVFIAGCGHKEADDRKHESGETQHAHEAEAGVTFSAKKGLLVPPATAKSIGLQVADVEERKLSATLQFSAQVYRAASEARFASLQPDSAPAALASGSVTPETAGKLSVGRTISAKSVDGGVAMPGRVVALKRDLAKANGQVEVLLAIADAGRPLASGALVIVNVSLGGEQAVVSVPRAALLRTTEGDFVYTVSGEHFVRAPVKLGSINPEFAEVTDGLYAGDQIVVQPVMTLWMAELQTLRGGNSCADGH